VFTTYGLAYRHFDIAGDRFAAASIASDAALIASVAAVIGSDPRHGPHSVLLGGLGPLDWSFWCRPPSISVAYQGVPRGLIVAPAGSPILDPMLCSAWLWHRRPVLP
jgi:hypothetical protein